MKKALYISLMTLIVTLFTGCMTSVDTLKPMKVQKPTKNISSQTKNKILHNEISKHLSKNRNSFKKSINVNDEGGCLKVDLTWNGKGTHYIHSMKETFGVKKSIAKLCYEIDESDNIKILDHSYILLNGSYITIAKETKKKFIDNKSLYTNKSSNSVGVEFGVKFLKFYDIEYFNKLHKELPELYNQAIRKY